MVSPQQMVSLGAQVIVNPIAADISLACESPLLCQNHSPFFKIVERFSQEPIVRKRDLYDNKMKLGPVLTIIMPKDFIAAPYLPSDVGMNNFVQF